MNIDELERLARAAQQDSESQARIEFLKIAANPAAILELVNINRELVAAAEKLIAGLHKRIRDAKYETPVFTGIADMHNALIRANGERNE